MKVKVFKIMILFYFLILLLFTDTTESPAEAEVEEREGLTFCNVAIPKSGGVQGEGVHWRRDDIIKKGGTKNDGL